MRLLHLLKTAQCAIVIQRVEAVVSRANLRLSIQRVGLNDPLLGLHGEGPEQREQQAQHAAFPRHSSQPVPPMCNHLHPRMLSPGVLTDLSPADTSVDTVKILA